jgi:hypothetical protein
MVLNKTGVSDRLNELDEAGLCPQVSPRLLEKYSHAPFLRIFLENPDKKFIWFNNYVFSRFIGITKKRRKMLEDLARAKKKEGFLIVHGGSPKDKENDSRHYDFVDYDLRGKVEPAGYFKIFSLDNLEGVICYDTFIMHVASILRKNLYIVMKERANPKEEERFKKTFIPMASCFEYLVRFLK